MSLINVIGAGAFGTALAVSLARAGQNVCLVARNPDHVKDMQTRRENITRLPGIKFPGTLAAKSEPQDTAKAHLIAVPTKSLPHVLNLYQTHFANQYVVACCKGVDLQSGLGPTGTIAAACPTATPAILSGPSFAVDIGAGLPTALTLATTEDTAAQELQNILQFANIRLYRTPDNIGVELGGALKNVIAIAAGIAIGAGLGESARAALMTRGFAEMKRFALAQGAASETLAGLSGFGDLILTCTSVKSRNFSHGITLGTGQIPDPSITVEGVRTALAVADIAKARGVDMPITTLVAAILNERISIQDSIAALLARPLKEE